MIDVDGFHALLAYRAGADGEITVHQRQYAQDLCVHKLVIHRTLKRMMAEGRITQIAGDGPNSRTYRVTPPSEWRAARCAPISPTSGDESSS